MSQKLREFIRNIRNAKSPSEERQIVAKECASIRTMFKEGDKTYRARNVAKMLYISMLGYPTNFGQIECLGLLASAKIHEKKIGYLSLMTLTIDSGDILMLATNSIKQDMVSDGSQYIQGMALSALGCIANTEILHMVSKELLMLTKANVNPYVRKKAVSLTAKAVSMNALSHEEVSSFIPQLVSDESHAVAIGGCHIIKSLWSNGSTDGGKNANANSISAESAMVVLRAVIEASRKVILSSSSPNGEYDFSETMDPFLQCGLIESLELLVVFVSRESQNPACAQLAVAGTQLLLDYLTSTQNGPGTNAKYSDDPHAGSASDSSATGTARLSIQVQLVQSVSRVFGCLRRVPVNIATESGSRTRLIQAIPPSVLASLNKLLASTEGSVQYAGISALGEAMRHGITLAEQVGEVFSSVLSTVLLDTTDPGMRRKAISVVSQGAGVADTSTGRLAVAQLVSLLPRVVALKDPELAAEVHDAATGLMLRLKVSRTFFLKAQFRMLRDLPCDESFTVQDKVLSLFIACCQSIESESLRQFLIDAMWSTVANSTSPSSAPAAPGESSARRPLHVKVIMTFIHVISLFWNPNTSEGKASTDLSPLVRAVSDSLDRFSSSKDRDCVLRTPDPQDCVRLSGVMLFAVTRIASRVPGVKKWTETFLREYRNPKSGGLTHQAAEYASLLASSELSELLEDILAPCPLKTSRDLKSTNGSSVMSGSSIANFSIDCLSGDSDPSDSVLDSAAPWTPTISAATGTSGSVSLAGVFAAGTSVSKTPQGGVSAAVKNVNLLDDLFG